MLSTARIMTLLLMNHFFISLSMQAQSFNDNLYRNSQNPMYWQNRIPYAGYWQQDVAYKIKASIDEHTNVINATEELSYWNNSPDTLHYVYFHLYQNAFVQGSYLQDLVKANKQSAGNMGKYAANGLGTTIDNLKINGQVATYEIDNTIMKVYLPSPLPPKQSVVFTMTFNTFFDRSFVRRRMSMYPSWGFMHYNGVHWYPRISVYDIKKGWDTDQHLNKELYGDYGLFDLELNFASNYIVEATGELQNPQEVYPGDLRERLDAKNFMHKPWNEKPSIITPYDSTQRKTWHYIAYNVHDVAFTADPAYRIAETDCIPKGHEGKPIQCIGLVTEPHASKWQNSSDYLAKIIKTFSEDFGMYEYPKIVAADANDGMEYPMLTLDGGADPDYHSLLVHEVGHNWFYGMIGNNETYRAALDEGFTQFLTAWGTEAIDGDLVIKTKDANAYKRKHRLPEKIRDTKVYNRYLFDAVRDNDKTLNTHSNDFHGAVGQENGYGNVYHKTATMLYNLQYMLGDELFQNAMRHYVAKWKMAHPYVEDFRQSIIEYTHEDLNWFFDQWMETNKHIDYGIIAIKKTKTPDEYKITFKRYGEMQMPLDFRVFANDKTNYNFTIPNTWLRKKTTSTVLPTWYGWDILHPTYTASVHIPSGIHAVQTDPSYRLADIDMMDNYKTPHTLLAPASHTLRVENYINNTADWKTYTAFWRPDVWWNAVDGMKLGLHIDGSYMNFMRKLYCTVWFNTRLGSMIQYRAYEGTGWWSNASPIDYTIRYETPLQQINKKINWGLESRFMDGFAKHSLYTTYKYKNNDNIKIELTTLYRNADATAAYLFYPKEWSSYSSGKEYNTKKNSYLQVQWQHPFSERSGNGIMRFTIRTPFTYSYSYFQAELIHKKSWNKLDINTRAFVRLGTGNNIPNESALFLQGGNPEEMMENKFTRSQGILPADMGGFATDGFSHIQAGGGLNLRGYTGYYAIDEDASGKYINYKGRSGAALNIEVEFDRLITFKPTIIKDYLHLDTYLFSDAGAMSRGLLNSNSIPELKPVSSWSKLRADAGIGAALTIKKFGPLEKVNPFVIRCDFPFFISSTPYAKPQQFAFRWVLGVSRAF